MNGEDVELDHVLEAAVRHRANLDSRCHELRILQSPKDCRASAKQEKARPSKWPLDPAPVVELCLKDGDQTKSYLHSPFWFCNAELEAAPSYRVARNSTTNFLTGCLVSSLHKIKLADNKEHGLFIFGDLNAKVIGQFRLRFTLYEMRQGTNGMYAANLNTVISEPFTVHSGKNWPGQAESTSLSRHLCEAGVKLRIRKETSKRKATSADWSADKRSALAQPVLPLPGAMPPPSYPYSAPHRQFGELVSGRFQFSSNGLGIRDHMDQESMLQAPMSHQRTQLSPPTNLYRPNQNPYHSQLQVSFGTSQSPVRLEDMTTASSHYQPTQLSAAMRMSTTMDTGAYPTSSALSSSPHLHRVNGNQDYTALAPYDQASQYHQDSRRSSMSQAGSLPQTYATAGAISAPPYGDRQQQAQSMPMINGQGARYSGSFFEYSNMPFQAPASSDMGRGFRSPDRNNNTMQDRSLVESIEANHFPDAEQSSALYAANRSLFST